MTRYEDFKYGRIQVSEADEYFYNDYTNEFFAPLIDLQDSEYLKEVRLGKEKLIRKKTKKYFERYPQFKKEDLSNEVLEKIDTLDKIVEELDGIFLKENQGKDIDRIKELCNRAYYRIILGDEK